MTTRDTGVDPREEEFLREGFAQELAAIVSGRSPTELIIVSGRRIRRRRQAAGGTLAVLGAAGVSLGLVASGAFGGAQGTVAPASTAKSAAPTAPATPAVKHSITVNSAAYDAAHGLAGSGTIDGLAWHAALTDPAQIWDSSGYQVAVGPAGSMGDPLVQTKSQRPAAPGDSLPLKALSSWNYQNENSPAPSGHYYVEAGEVPSDAGSVVIEYTDGKTATYPVVVENGSHLVAFAGAAGYDVARISVYSVHGDLIAYSVPYNDTDAAPYMLDVTWHQAGLPLPPEGSVTFSGTFEGTPYTLRVTENVIGMCADFEHGGTDESEGCFSSTTPTSNEQAAGWTSPGSAQVVYGYADPAVASVKLTLLNSTETVPLTVVSKLGMTFWSAAIPAGENPGSYTTYDAQGKALQTVAVFGG
ncbi:hypothetical protein KDL01_14815 [Actinospica durhamensis]|uniref:Uncharacterized protein n=1 Tax=Actinospica durhamensis TaxID=1508375 RepID=A0A941EQ98_9ACTN|nr:hypothetical protein [Actinospica durhamensis]MBR7834543.1 hypothetical protein [Actinospica durhamensis]